MNWIAVQEQLPAEGVDVLLCAPDGAVVGHFWHEEDMGVSDFFDHSGDLVEGVTHWMTLPQLPEPSHG